MSILAQKLDEVRTAATIAKRLTPAMVRAMTAPSITDPGGVWPREWVVANESSPGSLTVYAKVNTTVALKARELLAAGRYNEAGNVGHDFTDLGLLVRDVLVRGAEVLLEETRKEYETDRTETAPLRNDGGDFPALSSRLGGLLSMPVKPREPKVTSVETPPPGELVLDPQHLHLAYSTPEGLCRMLMAAHSTVGATVLVDRPSAMKAFMRVGILSAPSPTATTGSLTELGLGVRRAVAELLRIKVLGTSRTPLRHEMLAAVAADTYQAIALVNTDKRAFRGASGKARSFFLRSHEVKCLTDLADLGWIESRVRSGNPHGPAKVRLTEAGMRCLMTWDGAHERWDLPSIAACIDPQHQLLALIPPEQVINALPTKEVVRVHPDYYLAGPGRVIADRVLCEHDYHLTDSCPCCP